MTTPSGERDAALQVTSPRFTAQPALTNGLNNATVIIYQRATTNSAPSLPSAPTTYTYSPPSLSGLTNGWSFSLPAPAGGAYLFASTAIASASTATDGIAAGEWSTARLLTQDGASVTGARGAGQYYAVGSNWTDTVANAAVPAPKVVGDQVTISNSATFTLTKRWDGTAWNVPGTYLDGSLFVTGTISSTAIDTRNLTVRAADGTIIIGAGSALNPTYAAPGTLNSDVVVGGRNLYKNTMAISSGDGSYLMARTPTGFNVWGISSNNGMVRLYNVIPKNGTYTLSFDLALSINPPAYPLTIDVCDLSAATAVFNLSSTVTRYSMTFTVTNWSASVYNFIDFNGLSAQTYPFTNFKVEEGNKATGWTPAPEDVAADVATAATTATGVTLSATGALSGGGTSGQMTALPTIDAGNVLTFGGRNIVDKPVDYPYGSMRQFKTASVYGLTSASSYITLETTKQYPDASGGGVYQYAYADIKTYRRYAPAGNGDNTSWTAWVQDLDRNAYTGDLNASSDITLVDNGGMTVSGNTITKTGGTEGAWDSSVVSKESFVGGAYVSAAIGAGNTYMFGLNGSDYLADNSYTNIDFAVYVNGFGNLVWVEPTGSGTLLNGFAAGDVVVIAYDGSNVCYFVNGVQKRIVAANITGPLFFDSSFYQKGASLKNIRFGPLTSNNWSSIGGAGKPENNATVGATLGVNVLGQINAQNAATLVNIPALTTMSVTLGTFQSSATGTRTQLSNYGLAVFVNGAVRGKFGDLS